jgi:hypothetical protein
VKGRIAEGKKEEHVSELREPNPVQLESRGQREE